MTSGPQAWLCGELLLHRFLEGGLWGLSLPQEIWGVGIPLSSLLSPGWAKSAGCSQHSARDLRMGSSAGRAGALPSAGLRSWVPGLGVSRFFPCPLPGPCFACPLLVP